MNPLPLFSQLHHGILATIVLFCICIPLLGKNLSENKANSLAVRLAIFIISLEVFLFIYRHAMGIFDPTRNYPLHLCSLAEFCTAYALITKNQRAFELSFYWGFAASTQALLTPHLDGYKLFDIQFIIFFISHGLIILNVIWLIIVDKMKIRSSSLFETFLISNLILMPIGFINWIGNANYMYLRSKPPVENPLLMGDWPFYILGFEVIAITFFSILFIIMKLLNKVIIISEKKG